MTLASVPSGYTKLLVTFYGASSSGSQDNLVLQLNGDTGSHYWASVTLATSGPCTSTAAANGCAATLGAATPAIYSTAIVTFPYYTNTTLRKTWAMTGSAWNGSTAVVGEYGGGMWSNGDGSYPAVTSVKFFLSSGGNITGQFIVEATN